MSHHGMQDLVSRVAYLQRSCEVLLDRLREVDALGGDEPLDERSHDRIGDANLRYGAPIADHLELAAAYAREWAGAVTSVMNGPREWGGQRARDMG